MKEIINITQSLKRISRLYTHILRLDYQYDNRDIEMYNLCDYTKYMLSAIDANNEIKTLKKSWEL